MFYVTSAKRSYATGFPLTENPIREGSAWITAAHNPPMRTTPGLGFGTQGDGQDAVAILTGVWAANQQITGVVHTVNQQGSGVYEEVELLLRGYIDATTYNTYEFTCRCVAGSTNIQYAQIVRIQSPSFTYVTSASIPTGPGLNNGDMVRATAVGSLLSLYINDVLVAQGTDTNITTGNPGIGAYLQGATGLDADYGWASITAIEL